MRRSSSPAIGRREFRSSTTSRPAAPKRLAGTPAEPLAPVAERKALSIDVDNFDQRLKALKPRVAFTVPNKLTGEGNLSVDITFESMDDFSPAAVARKVGALNMLLEARTQLANLQTHIDGKSRLEEALGNILSQPALLQALTSAPKPGGDTEKEQSNG